MGILKQLILSIFLNKELDANEEQEVIEKLFKKIRESEVRG